MFLFSIFKKNKKIILSAEGERWNKFVDEICFNKLDDLKFLNESQKNAVLCFWYDSEMNNGGHSCYFDCFSNTDSDLLYNAILEVGYKEIADNYKKAKTKGKSDDYEETDNKYYSFKPDLWECLKKYVEENKNEIFK